MPTYLNSNNFSLPRRFPTPNGDIYDGTGNFGGAGFTGPNVYASQIPCPLIYDHIKSCQVCQHAVKNTCSSMVYGGTGSLQITQIDKNSLILYGIFFLILVILITFMYKR